MRSTLIQKSLSVSDFKLRKKKNKQTSSQEGQHSSSSESKDVDDSLAALCLSRSDGLVPNNTTERQPCDKEPLTSSASTPPGSPFRLKKSATTGLKLKRGSSGKKKDLPPAYTPRTEANNKAKAVLLSIKEQGGEFDSEGEREILQTATLKQIILYLCFSDNVDDFTLLSFVYGYGHFVTAQYFLSTLQDVTEDVIGGEGAVNPMFLLLLRKWLNVWFYYLAVHDKESADLAEKLLGCMKEKHPEVALDLLSLVERLKTGQSDNVKRETPPDTILPKNPELAFSENWKITYFDDLEVARQLCLIERDNFGKLSPLDLYHSKWTKQEEDTKVSEIAFFSNNLTRWLCYQVLQEKGNEKRAEILIHIIKIAGHLLNLHNFNTLLCFYLAIQNHVLQRLHGVWKLIPKKIMNINNNISVMDPTRNFTRYRALFPTLSPPIIPCHEIILKDLLYCTEVGNDFADSEKTKLNLGKLLTMGKTIATFLHRDSMQYNFYAEYSIYSSLREGVIDCPYTAEQLESLT